MKRILIPIVIAALAIVLAALYMQSALQESSGSTCPLLEQGLVLEYECNYTISIVYAKIRGMGSLILNMTSDDLAELCLNLEPPANDTLSAALMALLSGCQFISLEEDSGLEGCESKGRTKLSWRGGEHEVEVYRCSSEGAITKVYVDECEVPLKVEMLVDIGGGDLLLSCLLTKYP